MQLDQREDWRRAYALLDEFLDLAEPEREASLAARDLPAGVAAKLRELLAADAGGGLLDHPAPELGDGGTVSAPSLTGARFGPYEVVEELGRGGMAVVFRARRADGQFEREVALKILTLGQLARGSEEQLRREQRILARLEHPGIAALLDSGLAVDGTPWLAMELVDGEPIDAWCRARELDARAAVRLFLQVCEAVAYAHRNLVIHRDLKPSNIFVDRTGRVRLLDFGIAKLLGEAVAEATATRVLTPGYGAPEQFHGRPVTTATDVFAMGAVLYRLLTRQGAFPGRLDGLPVPPGEVPPAPPSTVTGHLHGVDSDLDNAVLMALRPEVERRYATAAALGEDLQRWLEGRPLRATPDRFSYRLRKLAQRHRKGAIAAGLATAGLIGGTAVALWQATVARAESRRAQESTTEAQRQLRRAEEVTRFLVDTFAAADPEAAGGREVTAEEIIHHRAFSASGASSRTSRLFATSSSPCWERSLIGWVTSPGPRSFSARPSRSSGRVHRKGFVTCAWPLWWLPPAATVQARSGGSPKPWPWLSRGQWRPGRGLSSSSNMRPT